MKDFHFSNTNEHLDCIKCADSYAIHCINMSQLRSDGTIWPWWWHKKSLSFFPCGTFCEQKSCLTEHTFSTSTFENPLSICEVKVRNICHPPESKLLRKKLYLLIQQVHSGSYGLKGWKTTESYSNRRKLSNRRMWSERTRPINYVHVRRYSEASHLCIRWLINSVSNWCEALHWGMW